MPCLYPDTVKKTRHTDGAVLFDSEVLTGNDKRYDTEMREAGVADIIKFGIAFSGKKVMIRTE